MRLLVVHRDLRLPAFSTGRTMGHAIIDTGALAVKRLPWAFVPTCLFFRVRFR
jgi:hypothetical protein